MESSPMSIKDRIAALKAKESTPVKPASSDAPATPASAEGASRRPSVADRIANMKAQSAAASPAPKSPAVGKWSAPTTPAAVPAPAAGTGQNETDLPISPPPGSSEAPETAVEPPSTPSAPAVDGATASTPEATEPKKSSIADRIASLKQGGSPPPMRMASKSMIQKGSAPLFPDPSAASPAADNAPGAAGAAGTGSEGVSEEPKRRSSIADRIAALKAAPVAAAPPAAEDSTGTGAGTGAPIAKRRLSTDRVAFANSIPLMMPGAPRPMMMFPKVVDEEHAKESAKEETNAGEFAHLNLTRAAVPSVKRKRAVTSVRLSADWQAMAAEEMTLTTATISTTSAGSAAIIEDEDEEVVVEDGKEPDLKVGDMAL